jgi:HSP20 family protein
MKNEVSARHDFLLDPFFDGLMGGNVGEAYLNGLEMRTDIKDDGTNYVLDIDLPGVDKKDIHVSLEDEYLTVKAAKTETEEEKGKKGSYLHRERYSGVASRSYYVGDIEEKNIKASFTNGVLTLTLPKEAEKKAEAAHTIAIQ